MRRRYKLVRTRSQTQFRLYALVALLGGTALVIDGLGEFLPGPVIGGTKIVAGALAGFGSVVFEILKARTERW